MSAQTPAQPSTDDLREAFRSAQRRERRAREGLTADGNAPRAVLDVQTAEAATREAALALDVRERADEAERLERLRADLPAMRADYYARSAHWLRLRADRARKQRALAVPQAAMERFTSGADEDQNEGRLRASRSRLSTAALDLGLDVGSVVESAPDEPLRGFDDPAALVTVAKHFEELAKAS